jgi:hypothetical protein
MSVLSLGHWQSSTWLFKQLHVWLADWSEGSFGRCLGLPVLGGTLKCLRP